MSERECQKPVPNTRKFHDLGCHNSGSVLPAGIAVFDMSAAAWDNSNLSRPGTTPGLFVFNPKPTPTNTPIPMAIKLIANYSKKLGLPGYSSHQFSVSVETELVTNDDMEQLEVANDRRRIAEDASRRLQADLNGFIRESVASMREETARLATEVLATIDGSENGVHQRTLNRLTTFIDSFKSLNFASDQQLEATLEKFRRDLLTRSAEDYRNDKGAMASLTDGLARLRENAVQLARSDVRDVLARFGQMGARKLAVAS